MDLSYAGRPIRVANIIEEGRWGGPQKRITMVASALKKHAVETVVFLPDRDSDRFCDELTSAGVAFKAQRLHRLGRGWRTLASYVVTFIAEVLRLRRELLRGQFQLVHVSGGAWQFKGALAGHLARIPVVWHLNDSQMPAPIVLLFRFLARWVAAGFLVTANRVYRYYIEGTSLAGKPVARAQAPVDTAAYEPSKVEPDPEIRRHAGVRVVTVANISPVKGLETLIDAAARLGSSSEAYSFIVVGPVYATQQAYFGTLRARIRKSGLEGSFHFLGRREDIRGVMRAATVFVCSSIAEAGPMTVWEAMAMECAIVSTDVGDVASYIRSGENGIVVPVGNADAMAEAIAKVARDPGLRRELGRRARLVACSELDVEVAARHTADCYAGILARGCSANASR